MSQYIEFASLKPNPDMPGVPDIDPQDVWKNRGDIAIVDVRRPDEFTGELGHIPGAQHVVLDTLPMRLAEIPRDKSVVFVCLSGGRSSRACSFALEQGLDHVYNMKGGMKAWTQLALAVEGKSKY
jgi:rhodanese-related sulfurtransferase